MKGMRPLKEAQRPDNFQCPQGLKNQGRTIAPPPLIATNQAKIPYPKPLKNSNEKNYD